MKLTTLHRWTSAIFSISLAEIFNRRYRHLATGFSTFETSIEWQKNKINEPTFASNWPTAVAVILFDFFLQTS